MMDSADNWHLHAFVTGFCIRYGDHRQFVIFAPDRFGKIVSSSGCGYSWSTKELLDATQVVLNSLPKPHRFGSRFSEARQDLYRAVINELRRVDYRPRARQPITKDRPDPELDHTLSVVSDAMTEAGE